MECRDLGCLWDGRTVCGLVDGSVKTFHHSGCRTLYAPARDEGNWSGDRVTFVTFRLE